MLTRIVDRARSGEPLSGFELYVAFVVVGTGMLAIPTFFSVELLEGVPATYARYSIEMPLPTTFFLAARWPLLVGFAPALLALYPLARRAAGYAAVVLPIVATAVAVTVGVLGVFLALLKLWGGLL